VDKQAGTDHREQHQPQGQLDHRALVAEQPLLGNPPAIQEQQRRQEQQEEQLRVQGMSPAEEPGNGRAQADLHQRQRQADRQDTHQVTTGHHGQQHCKHHFNGMHGSVTSPQRGAGGQNQPDNPANATTGGAATKRLARFFCHQQRHMPALPAAPPPAARWRLALATKQAIIGRSGCLSMLSSRL